MISRWLLFILILILLYLGILYAPPKYIEIETNALTLSPLNKDEYGTYYFASRIKKMGYKLVYGDPSKLAELGDSDIYILIGPDKSLSEAELSYIKSFLERGGSILVADEKGIVNNLLKSLFDAGIDYEYSSLYWFYTVHVLNETERYSGTSSPVEPVYAIASLDPPPTNFYESLYNNESISKGEIVGALHMHHMKNFHKSPLYIANIPSYIIKPGSLKISGLIFSLSKNYLEEALNSTKESGVNLASMNDYEIYIYSGYYIGASGERVYVVADTCLFTNAFTNSEFYNISKDYYINLLRWLSKGYNSTVLFDITHYKPYKLKQKMPPPGRIFDSILKSLIGEFSPDKLFQSLYSQIGIVNFMMISIPLTVVGLYVSISRYINIPRSKLVEEKMKEFRVRESMMLKTIKGGRRDKRFYMDLVLSLYDLMNEFLRNLYGISLADSARGSLTDPLREKLGDEGVKELVRLSNRLNKDRIKILENRFLPIIFSWRSEFKKLIESVDNILRLLGYEFIYHEEGLKKIEYLFR